MKRIIPCIFIASVTHAQITINHYEFVPIGKTFIMAYDTVSQLPGNAGPNQIWNFSGLQSPFLDTVLVNDPNSTPYLYYFPSANVSFSAPSAIYYQYFNNTNTGFYLLGMVVVTKPNPPSVSTFIPSSKYCQWPMNYLDTFTDSCVNISIFPSIGPYGTDTSKYISHYKEKNTIDAWGKITTPLGTFDCLRQKKVQARVDSSWFFNSQTGAWSFMNTYTDTTSLYDWLSNDATAGFILAEISYTQATNSYSGVYWMKGTIAGINNDDNSGVISVYPNPAGNVIFVKTKRSGIIELYDLNGKLLRQWKEDSKNHALDTSGFSNGVYLLCLQDKENKFPSAKMKVVIAK